VERNSLEKEEFKMKYFNTNQNRQIPHIFYGTAWKKENTAELVRQAIVTGFRAVDTACQPKHYNESGVGIGITQSEVPRDQLFIQTKFTPESGQDPNTIPYNPSDSIDKQILTSFDTSCKNLRVNYLDSLILHSPLATIEQTKEAWTIFEHLHEQNKVRHLGISNCYSLELFKELYNSAKVKPTLIQNRFYADTGYDKELRAFCDSVSVFYQSFWTLSANPHILNDSIIKDLTEKYNKSAATIFFAYLSTIKIIPLTGTTSKDHMKDSLSLSELELKKKDIELLESLFNTL
jgi:diketogulonate reductase-like aldo/keto reductase